MYHTEGGVSNFHVSGEDTQQSGSTEDGLSLTRSSRHYAATQREHKNNQGIVYASNRIPSAAEKKRGRGRPRKSEQKSNHKTKKFMKEAEAGQMNLHPA